MEQACQQEVLKPGMERVVCDLCRSSDSEVIMRQRDLLLNVTDEEFSIVRCLRCGLVYLNPRPAEDLLGSFYPPVYYPPVAGKERPSLQRQAKKASAQLKRWVLEDYYGYPSTSETVWWRPLRKLLLWPDKTWRELKGRYPLPWRGQGKVLDIGCGAGGNLKNLQDQGWEPHGIEISEIAAAHARELTKGQIHTGTVESASFPPGSFDLVLMSHSLEHLPSPVDALRRIHSFLKDDGLLVVHVPNVHSLEFKLFGRWWFPLDPPRHFYHFDRASLSDALARAGFKVEGGRTAVSSVFMMASLDRVWKHRFGREVPIRRLIEKLIAGPLSFIAGRLGYGTELTVHAVKQDAEPH
ncbi:MAG TPA: class I SAM-dependent methyltransferase [Nitrospira sp.]|nr:class I SAM-dependent methyltransferase [Nitrospira sp.]